MSKIACFGEILYRLSPQANGEWLKQNSTGIFIGGAELNVASALAAWKQPVCYITAMPDNYLSKDSAEHIQERGVEPVIIYRGERTGTYYLPQGADLKNAGVIYDRAYSSFSKIKTGELDWTALLKDVNWLHITAISPALTQDTADVCKEALQFAKANNTTTSIDLNYRAKLWQYGKQPIDIIPELAQYCDVIMGNIWAANKMLGTDVKENYSGDKAEYLEAARKTSTAIMNKYPACKVVANTFRFDVPNGIEYYATLDTNEQQYVSPQFFTASAVDRSGSGDCFMGGLIYGINNKHTEQDIINFAAAAAFGKLQEKGDATKQTTEDVKQTLSNGQ